MTAIRFGIQYCLRTRTHYKWIKKIVRYWRISIVCKSFSTIYCCLCGNVEHVIVQLLGDIIIGIFIINIDYVHVVVLLIDWLLTPSVIEKKSCETSLLFHHCEVFIWDLRHLIVSDMYNEQWYNALDELIEVAQSP